MFRYIWIFLAIAVVGNIGVFASSPCGKDDIPDSKKQEYVIREFAKKRHDSSYKMNKLAMKSFNVAKTIILFPEGVDQEKVLIDHGKDIAFLTTPPHYFHKHVLVSTNWHDNDIRLTYDPDKDDFIFHTGESVREKRKKAENDPNLMYDLDFFALHEKEMDYKPHSLYPSFQRKGDGKFYVEVVSGSLQNLPTLAGNHNWLRLIDDEGKVISVGVHPFQDLTLTNAYSKSPVRFSNCDLYEWIDNRTFYAHRFPMTKEEFYALKEEIIRDMYLATDPDTTFDYSIFGWNCADWIVEKLITYLTIDRDEMTIEGLCTLTPNLLQFYRHKMPDVCKMVISPILQQIHTKLHVPRFVWIWYGGGFTTSEENNHSVAFWKNEWEFISDETMHYVVHPFLLEEYLQNHEEELFQERERQIELLKIMQARSQ